MSICVITVSASAISLLRAEQELNPGPELALHYVGGTGFNEAKMLDNIGDLERFKIVLVDLMGASQDFCRKVEQKLNNHSGQVVVLNSSVASLRFLTRLGKFSMKPMAKMADSRKKPDMARMQEMLGKAEKLGTRLPFGPMRDMRNYAWLVKYWLYASPENIQSLRNLLRRDYLGDKSAPKPQPPKVLEDMSIYHPGDGAVYDDLAAYRRVHPFKPGLPTLALLFYSNNYPVDTHGAAADILSSWEGRFNLLPIAAGRLMGQDLAKFKLLLEGADPKVEGLVNLLAFRLGAGPVGGEPEEALDMLAELDIPLFHPFFLSKQKVSQWEDSLRGANPGEFLISMFLPELDGAIETAMLGAMDNIHGHELELVPERVETYGKRVEGWLRLRRKANAEKKIALVFYDYPPGEANLGGGAFLDGFQSLAAIMARLKADGYDLEPLSADELRRAFIEEGRSNTPRWHQAGAEPNMPVVSRAEYHAWCGGSAVEKRIDQAHGAFPGPVMSRDDKAFIPGIISGKLFIGLQPARGEQTADAASYHDKHLPPHHQYLAFYKWLEHGFGADAVIHLGTHGTVEFTPGKETALSGDCCPDYFLGSMPHTYIYYSGNPAEAMIAKRRSKAAMCGHVPPPFSPAESYGEMAELEDTLAQWDEVEKLNPTGLFSVIERAQELASRLGWPEMGRAEMETRLNQWRTALIPGRMHTFGHGYSGREALEFLYQAATIGQSELAALPGLLGLRDDNGGELTPPDEKALRAWLNKHVADGLPLEKGAPEGLLQLADSARAAFASLAENREFDGLMGWLSGRYVAAGMAGDLMRNPEVLPTGRNLYQFDPRKVPSSGAVTRGKEIAHNTLLAHDQGKTWPKSVAVVLWGLETAKTHGETVAQILAYLGLEFRRDPYMWEPGLEVIPLEELGRPRVDVVVQMCGFFRDMFPNLLSLLNRAFAMVAELDEPEEMNPLKANSLEAQARLKQEGIAAELAEELSRARIFGPTASNYGTALTEMVNSKNWQVENDLVSAYTKSLCHVYSENCYGKAMPELLKTNLSKVEVVSQIRSSMDYEITDLDHYYEFLGGLTLSAGDASGKKVKTVVSDTSTGKVRSEDIRDAIGRGVHTRLFNPKWLDAMLDHDFHGAQQINSRMENLVGLAATTGEVDSDVFDRAMECFIKDKNRYDQIRNNNPYALVEIMERMFEAHNRGYWDANDSDLQLLRDLYLQNEAEIEDSTEIQLT